MQGSSKLAFMCLWTINVIQVMGRKMWKVVNKIVLEYESRISEFQVIQIQPKLVHSTNIYCKHNHSKENHQQNEKATYGMGKNVHK